MMSLATQQFTGTFVADPAHSSFQFAVGHMVGTFRAAFASILGALIDQVSPSDEKVA